MGEIIETAKVVYRDFTLDGVQASGPHEPTKQSIRELFARVEAVAALGAGGFATVEAIADLPAGAPGEGEPGLIFVTNDPTPSNIGPWVYRDGDWGFFTEYYNGVADVVDAHLAEVLDAQGEVFEPFATDAYAKAFIRGVTISDNNDDGHFFNYSTLLISGTTYRFWLRLHSAARGGAEVARFDYQDTINPATLFPDSLYLTLKADASDPPGWPTDVGVTALIDIDWDAVAWDKNLTTYTDMTETGVRPGLVELTGETRAKWTVPAVPVPSKRLMTVGSGYDFPTLLGTGSAWEMVEQGSFAATMSRSTFPSSNICSPERPLEVRLSETGYEEEVTLFFHAGIYQSALRMPHGLILHLPYRDQRIFADTAGNTGPVIEMNKTGMIYGEGLIEQLQGGYNVHIDDSGTIPEPDVREQYSVIRGVRLRKSYDDTVPVIGIGMGSAQTFLLDGARLERPVNTSNGPYIAGHNTAGEVRAGLMHIRNVTSDIAGSAAFLSMNKQHASDVAHGIAIENSDCPRITIGNGAGGDPGYRRIGSMTGITVTGTLAV